MKIHHYKVLPTNSLKETIRIMKELENITLNNIDFVRWVKETFKTSCNDCKGKLVHNYIVNNFTYILDTFDEVIQAPYVLLQTKKGDCDDFSLFSLCVLKILNEKPEYILFGKIPGKFSHIAVKLKGKIIDGTNNVFNDWQEIIMKYKYYLIERG